MFSDEEIYCQNRLTEEICSVDKTGRDGTEKNLMHTKVKQPLKNNIFHPRIFFFYFLLKELLQLYTGSTNINIIKRPLVLTCSL